CDPRTCARPNRRSPSRWCGRSHPWGRRSSDRRPPRRRLRVALCRRLPSSADHLHGRLGDGPWFGRDNFDAIVHSCSPSRPRHGRAIRYGLTGQCGPAAEARQPPVESTVLDRRGGTDLTPTRVSVDGPEGCTLKTLVNPFSGSLRRQDVSSLLPAGDRRSSAPTAIIPFQQSADCSTPWHGHALLHVEVPPHHQRTDTLHPPHNLREVHLDSHLRRTRRSDSADRDG